jgi:hypothetical protein
MSRKFDVAVFSLQGNKNRRLALTKVERKRLQK